MRRAVIIMGLLMGLSGPGRPVLAASPPASVNTLVTGTQNRLGVWQTARSELARTRNRQGALAGRITALKRDGAPSAELQRLLRASLAADQQLEAALTHEANARADVERGVRGGVARIDQEIRGLVPQLKTGPIDARRGAARRINELRDARKSLRDALAALDQAQVAPRRDWSRYQVQVEPLDGPSELDEKADFVEDTRDKLNEKRQALATLLKEARQEQQISRAARDFDTYVRIFDEEARSDRVTRQPTRGDSNEATSVGSPTGAGTPTDQAGGFTGNRGNESPPATPVENTGGVDSNLGNGSPTTDAPGDKVGSGDAVQGPTVSTPELSAPPVARDINPDLLLNLRVSQLEGQDLDLATLQRLIAELEDLDGYLAAQAASIRQRARKIEADEARDPGR